MNSGTKSHNPVTTRMITMFVALVAILTLNAVVSYGQGINYPVGNPTGTSGTGNARTDADNLFIRNNVAGMTEIPVNAEEENSGQLGDSGSGKWRLMGEIQGSIYKYTRTRTIPTLGSVASRATIFNPGFAGEITYTTGNHKYALGMGAYQLFGFQSKFEESPAQLGRRAAFFDSRVASNDIAFGGAARLHKTLSVGGSFIFGRAFLNLKMPIPAFAFGGILDEVAKLDVDDIGGAGASFGVHFRPTNTVSFGLNYKTKREYKLTGDLDTANLAFVGGVPQFVRIRPRVQVKFELPAVAEAGIEVKPSKKLLLAFDFRFYDYTATFQRIDLKLQANPSAPPLQSVRIDGEDVRSIRFGGVYSATEATKIHFGTAFTANGIPDAFITPGLTNVGGVDVSGGIGKRIFGRWVNVGVAGIFGRTRTVGPPQNTVFPGRYKGNGILFGIGLRM